MKINGISLKNRNDINKIKSNVEGIELHFRPTHIDVLKIIQKTQNLKHLFISNSSRYTLAMGTIKLIEASNIKLITKDGRKLENRISIEPKSLKEFDYNTGD